MKRKFAECALVYAFFAVPTDTSSAVEQHKEAVAYIRVGVTDPITHARHEQCQGSGFLIDKDGYLVSARHVILCGKDVPGGDRYVDVSLRDRDAPPVPAQVVDCRSDNIDLCLIKISSSSVLLSNITAVFTPVCRTLKTNESIVALGYPFGAYNPVLFVHGEITGDLATELKYPSNVPIVPGMSGGPVLDMEGYAVGVNEGAAALVSTFTFVQPLTYARSLMANIGLSCDQPPNPPKTDELVAAAKKEGQLTVIALPHDWCGYDAVIDAFKSKYGLTINELNPDAGSGDEVEAIKANKTNKGPQAPDVIDVSLSFGPSAKADGLIQPYKVSTWSTIPESQKDADGYWYGDYYGVLAFEVNKDIVKKSPADWPDLLGADYKNSVALAGDPRTANQAVQGVFAAGLSAANGDVGKAASEGLKYFATLNKNGNFVPVIGKAASVAQGATPIVIRWDYNALADRDTLKGNPDIDVVVPKSGVVAGVYVQAISAFAPHPAAAKLWMEHLYSDEGQLGWLKGYCHPIRFQDLIANKKVPAEILAKLPAPEGYAKALFPTLKQQTEAKETITKQWDSVVGAQVK